MQSTRIMALRVFVTLACMVVVPLLAIFGTSWASFGSLSSNGSKQTPPAAVFERPTAAEMATGFGPPLAAPLVMSPAAAQASPPTMPIGPAQAPIQLPAMQTLAGEPLSAEMAAVAAKFNGPLTNAAEPAAAVDGSVSVASPSGPFAPLPTRTGARGIPSRRSTPVAMAQAPEPSAMSGSQESSPVSHASFDSVPAANLAERIATDDWFKAAQDHLQAVGAVSYQLETWGRNGELYRFHCDVASAENPDSPRHFEAIDRNPAQSVQLVLNQVDAWRTSR
ncbi:MAG TPA: hypothetical protein VG713_14210 [Pirellulales bacterium]|nr:hypothetical protein [Pirellulales bacterium]